MSDVSPQPMSVPSAIGKTPYAISVQTPIVPLGEDPERGRRLALCRREEHEYGKFFRDVVEAVLHFSGHEEHAASGNFLVFFSRSETCFPANDVVHLVFVMRALRIGGSGGQHIESCAHGGHAQKLAVQLAALGALSVNFVDCEEFGLGTESRFDP